jgi:hypothetical protein
MAIKNSQEFIKEIRRNPENFYIIHYSCENLYGDGGGLSPRVTSIAVGYYATAQTVSFSAHAVAEEMHIPRDKVEENFAKIELALLKDFYSFVRDRKDRVWVHWNMRNLTFGFEHLAHRFKVLGGADAPVIAVEQRLNLNDLLADRYGRNYALDPKLRALMELNGGLHRHFLTGQEEVQAFKNGEFIRLHNSTLCKVGFMQHAIRCLVEGKLRTASRGWGVRLDRMFESRLMKGATLFGAVIGILVSVWQIYLWLREAAPP